MQEEGGEVQELGWPEVKRGIEREWCTEHKRKKNRKCNVCMQEDCEADRAAKSCRIVMRLVSCC
jgi:hypothetical protein